MANFICEAHFWSFSNDIILPDNTTAYHKLYSKNYLKTTYTEEKIAYSESRNVLCKPESKFGENLHQKIQELDGVRTNKPQETSRTDKPQVLKIQWISRNLVEIIYTDGLILSVVVNQFTGDILHIHKDGITKELDSEKKLCDVLLSNGCMIASYLDANELSVFFFSSPRFDPSKVESSVDAIFTKDEKPKIKKIAKIMKLQTTFDGPNAAVRKHLVFSFSKNQFLLWFEPQARSPWNVIVFLLGWNNLVLVCSTSTSGIPRGIKFSDLNGDIILSVESSFVSSATLINGYKFEKDKMSLAYSTEVPTEGQAVCCDWSRDGNRVAFATNKKELFVFSSSMKVTRSTRLSFDADKVRWMSNNCCVIVFGRFGEMQFYDVALNLLKLLDNGSVKDTFHVAISPSQEIVAMDTNMFFDRNTIGLMDVNECFLLSMRSNVGANPVTMVTVGLGTSNGARGLTSNSIFNQHLHHGKIIEAHELLQSLDWSFEASSCLYCLVAFVNHLLRVPPDNDVINYIQSSLSKFYSSHNSQIVRMEYGDRVINLARRYFKLLMRLKMFEKCYLIARDIQHRDLFMELYYAARDHGETALAESSRREAMELEEEMLECDFQPDLRDSILSLDSLDSMYSSPQISEYEDDVDIETIEVNDREIMTQLIRDTENLLMSDLNDEFSQFIK